MNSIKVISIGLAKSVFQICIYRKKNTILHHDFLLYSLVCKKILCLLTEDFCDMQLLNETYYHKRLRMII